MRKLIMISVILCLSCCIHAQGITVDFEELIVKDTNEYKLEPLRLLCPVEDEPVFPGGKEALKEFINDRIYYPATALQDSIEGAVQLRFIVTKEGKIRDVTILKSLHPHCDSIAAGIVRSMMPRWEPGRHEGKPVDVSYSLSVDFSIPTRGKYRILYALPDDFNVPFSHIYEMPAFPGGEEGLREYLRKNLRYPQVGGCFQGRVIIQFIVDEKGKVHNPAIVRSLIPEADREALRLIREMPDWTPTGDGTTRLYHLLMLPIAF
ncbi:TonB family protein [Dysgonomonas sp. 25]|uniref:TonB family protein n=1 Tax=Dysgonomonas sp. 25 TaxID=2302933 RepID=UPI0013D7A21E|nr:TonB family protein [Dysgonomonas sp. 25]